MINENYNNLLIENNQLKERICILEKKEITTIQFYTDIINKNVEINNLKESNDELNLKIMKLEQENLELKIKINKLEQDNIKLKNNDIQLNTKIDKLEKDNVQLKTENAQLKQDIIKLNIKIDELEKNNAQLKQKEITNKIVRCIQDLNRYEQLEKKLKQPFNVNIKKLRNFRNEESHFIYEDDSFDTINSKKIYLLEYLKTKMDVKILDKIEKVVSKHFIQVIIDYLENNSIQKEISEDDLNDIEIWWE
jgi:chromosome segregation ATPase